MHGIDIVWNTDLNLLVVLDVLTSTRSVTATARRLGRTQSSVSHALARLRQVFDDELFVRTATGLLPTPRAEQLGRELERIIPLIAGILTAPVAFDPAASTASIRVIASDLVQALLVQPLSDRLRATGPAMTMHVLPYGSDEERRIREGEADLWIQVPAIRGEDRVAEPPAGLAHEVVLDDDFVGLARSGHRGLRDLTVARFAALPHVLVAPRGRQGSYVDTFLESHGLRRRIELTLSTALAVGDAIVGTDRVVTLPRRFARRLVDHDRRLRAFELPLPAPRFVARMVWDERFATPATRWFRTQVAEVLR